MSLEHNESLMDRLSQSAEDVKLTPAEQSLQDALQAKQRLMVEQGQSFMEELFAENSTLPVKTKNVQVANAGSFRDSFIQAQLQPLLRQDLLTLSEFLRGVDSVYRRLVKLDIMDNCLVTLHKLPKQAWSRNSAADVVPVFTMVPQKRFYAKTGTNIGNGEGDGYIQFQWKNVFGGAENVMFDAITGTKTPSSYLLNYSQPVLNDARYLWDTSVFVNTRKLDWIQSSVAARGVTTKISTRYDSPVNFDAAVENCWRVLSNHSSRSMAVLQQSKDTLKSSLLLNAKYDTRDHPITPTTGQYLRLGWESSGIFAFNNVKFSKLVCEAQSAHRLGRNHSVIVSQKAGALFGPGESNILDRFHVGGPNDVRSFSLQGLGPKEGISSVGGDYFVSGGISLVSKIPKTPDDTGFKFHSFLNYGKLIAGQGTVQSIFSQLTKEHSVGVGTGIMYNHPSARFELNFVLPLAVHANDFVRKGFQYGVGISFL